MIGKKVALRKFIADKFVVVSPPHVHFASMSHVSIPTTVVLHMSTYVIGYNTLYIVKVLTS